MCCPDRFWISIFNPLVKKQNKDEPCNGQQRPADVILQLEEKTRIWVYLKHVNRNCGCDGCVCMTHVRWETLLSCRRGCPVCHLSHQSAQSSPPVQNSGYVWIGAAWFHEKVLLDAPLSSVKLWLSNQLASVHLENQKRPSLSEQCAKSRDLFLDRQIILYSCTHHRGNTSDRLYLIRWKLSSKWNKLAGEDSWLEISHVQLSSAWKLVD